MEVSHIWSFTISACLLIILLFVPKSINDLENVNVCIFIFLIYGNISFVIDS